MNIKKVRILIDVILFAALLLLCFAGCQNNDYADIYETPGAEGSVGQATNTDDYSGGLLGDKPNAGSTPPLAEPIATPIGGVLPDVKTQAEQIISRSRRYNTTDSFFNSLKHFWGGYEIYYFLSEENPELYGQILKEIEDRGNSSHETLRKFYDNIDTFFSKEDGATLDILRYYKFIGTDGKKAFWISDDVPERRDEFAFYADYKFADGAYISVSDAVLYAPYYLIQSLYTNKTLEFNGMALELSQKKHSELFISDRAYSNPVDCVTFIPGFDPLLYMCAYYGDEVKNLANHELVFSAPIATIGGYYDYYSGRANEAYFIPFYDKTADRYGMSSFDENGILLSIGFRK